MSQKSRSLAVEDGLRIVSLGLDFILTYLRYCSVSSPFFFAVHISCLFIETLPYFHLILF